MRSTTKAGAVWVAGWLGLVATAMANGAFRVLLLERLTSEQVAHLLSTAILLCLITAYARWLHGRRPLPSARTAVAVGVTWALLTVGFELGLGTLRGMTWSEMLADYDLLSGRVWILVPLWTAAVPTLVRRLSTRRPPAAREPRPDPGITTLPGTRRPGRAGHGR